MKHLGFDIGATHLRITDLREGGIGPVVRINTPKDPSEAIDAFAELTAAFGPEIETATGGVAAIIAEDGSIVTSTNLPDWNGYPFARMLAARLRTNVRVRNDAELAGLGEAVFGAGKEAKDVAYIGVGTGVGTSHIVEGKIEARSSDEGRAKIIALADGTTLEERVAGHALTDRFGISPEKLLRKEWDALTPLLAEGVANAIALWSPELVVLGGSLMNEEDGFRVGDVSKALARFAGRKHPPVVRAELGDSSGLYGAKAWEEQGGE